MRLQRRGGRGHRLAHRRLGTATADARGGSGPCPQLRRAPLATVPRLVLLSQLTSLLLILQFLLVKFAFVPQLLLVLLPPLPLLPPQLMSLPLVLHRLQAPLRRMRRRRVPSSRGVPAVLTLLQGVRVHRHAAHEGVPRGEGRWEVVLPLRLPLVWPTAEGCWQELVPKQ